MVLKIRESLIFPLLWSLWSPKSFLSFYLSLNLALVLKSCTVKKKSFSRQDDEPVDRRLLTRFFPSFSSLLSSVLLSTHPFPSFLPSAHVFPSSLTCFSLCFKCYLFPSLSFFRRPFCFLSFPFNSFFYPLIFHFCPCSSISTFLLVQFFFILFFVLCWIKILNVGQLLFLL